jgi:hypothetical protein
MRNYRQVRSAFVLALVIGGGLLASSPTLYAAGPSDKSVSTRCALLAKAIDAATASLGADSSLVAYLQGQYATYCAG